MDITPTDALVAPFADRHDHDEPSVFLPENLLREARRQRGLPTGPVPAVCLLDPDGDVVRHLVREGRAQRSPSYACYHTALWETDLAGQRLGIVGCAVGAPFAVLVADTIGIFGGYVVGTTTLGFNSAAYIKNTVDFLEIGDVVSGLIKAAAFGFIIALMGCYHGFNSQGGAQGVGRATTSAVVSASILILAANYVMTSLLFSE